MKRKTKATRTEEKLLAIEARVRDLFLGATGTTLDWSLEGWHTDDLLSVLDSRQIERFLTALARGFQWNKYESTDFIYGLSYWNLDKFVDLRTLAQHILAETGGAQ